MKVIAVTERNRYEQVYTDEIWDAVMEDGDTFDTYLLNQVRAFLENMKTMTLLAKDQEITLSSGELDRVRRVARNYYSDLSRNEIEYLGISEEDVVTLYEDYHTANRVVEILIPLINSAVTTFANLTHRLLMQETIDTHRAITDAILNGDSVGARCAMIMHLTYNRQMLVKMMEEHG